jgi:hypothetical protein
VGDCQCTFNAKTTLEASNNALKFIKDMSFANSKPFHIAKTSATSEFDNKKTCEQRQHLHYLSPQH